MPPMRTVALAEQPGEREIASFTPLIHRPLVIAGNGPSAALPPQHRIPADPVVFRMNWFFLESHYHLGSHVDGWFFSVPHQALEESLGQEVRSGRYTIDRLLSPMQLPSGRDGDGWGHQLLDAPLEQHDHWAVVSRYPRLARCFMSRPGLPTTGMQALGFALAVGFRDIYLCGIDLYESAEARYGYTVTDQVAAALTKKDLTPGYEKAHSLDTDLAFLRACLAEFPEARVHNLSESLNLSVYLQPPPARVDGPDLAAGSTSRLGEAKDRVVATSPAVAGAGPLVVTAPRDRRLWQEVDGRRCAYVTVVSGNYHHGTRALANSLRRVSDVPLLALATADADRVALAASDIHVIDVPEIRNPNTQRFQRRFAQTYTKLNVFRLDFLDRLVYLDSDTIVRKNIDELFSGQGFAAVPDSGFDRAKHSEFNSGVLAIDPSHELFCQMLDSLAGTPSRDGGDQGFLNAFLPGWQPLPQEYNTTKRIFAHHPALYNEQDVKVLHYVGNKPWDPVPLPGEDRYAELDRDWLDCLEAWELRELVADLRTAAAVAQASDTARLPLGGPGTRSPFRQAQQLTASRRPAQAEGVLREAWRSREPTPAELRELARALRAQGRHAESVTTLRAAARLAPQSTGAVRELQAARARALVSGLRRLNTRVRRG